ncbi:hypothetical protein FB389_0877 [Rarobacter incanus]|uniref:Uncharacterized protein n=1 Tax=Rarobacter incanus TaxID=153494 RepID=A0A542SPM8_9MICO|nr:hypothetical protein FB389_0877 [Rarobacter incanus]
MRYECARCSGRTVTTMPLTLPDGRDMTFVTCHVCESNVWVDADGARWTKDQLFAAARK